MTYEQKTIVSLEDIKAICFQCKKCSAKISVSPDSGLSAPTQCLQCREPWIKDISLAMESVMQSVHQEQQSSLIKFVKSLAKMRDPEVLNSFGFRILLEFDGPKH
jgi:hypothetical protein